MTLKELQDRYGKPTLEQGLSAFYTMMKFKEYIKTNDDYIHPHNFQRERSDIVNYIYCSHELVKEIMDWDRGTEENLMKKIPTLFKRVFDGHKIVDVLPKITDGCEEAFLHGEATVKWDGSCCAVINGELYKRYDAKKGKPIPDGAIKCQNEPDPITGHLPCWVKCDRNNPADKWFCSAYDTTINRFKNYFGEYPKMSGTYEAIGKHFNGNPYKFNIDYLAPHGIRKVNVERTFEDVRKFLAENYIEGIVFWLYRKPVCKIKRSDFGFEWNGKGGDKYD